MCIVVNRVTNSKNICFCFSKVIIAPLALIGQEILQEFVEGIWENVGAITVFEYMMEGSFVEVWKENVRK